ncbi:LysR family transcriptional regulator [Pseudonocardia sp. MCCB 268]|nr:LysR family transcriptional regulator [Pseudonocardia cytotoxica]
MFVAVAEGCTSRAGGRAAAPAQPHLNQTVRALETELGAEMFRRTTRRVETDPAGLAPPPARRALLTRTDEARAAGHRRQRTSAVARSDLLRGPVGARRGGPARPRAVRGGARSSTSSSCPAATARPRSPSCSAGDADLALARFVQPPVGVAGVSSPASQVRGRGADRAPAPPGHDGLHRRLRDEPLVAFGVVRLRGARPSSERCHAAGFAPSSPRPPDSWTCMALVSARSVCTFPSTASAVTHLPLDGVLRRKSATRSRRSTRRPRVTARRRVGRPTRVLQTSDEVLPGAGTASVRPGHRRGERLVVVMCRRRRDLFGGLDHPRSLRLQLTSRRKTSGRE